VFFSLRKNNLTMCKIVLVNMFLNFEKEKGMEKARRGGVT
jgi:hypothetical protein